MHEGIITLVGTVILAVLTTSAIAEPAPLNLSDFAYGTELTSTEAEFRRFTLTPVMIKDIRQRNFGDVRVFDEDDDLVPIMVRKKDRNIKTSWDRLVFYPHIVAGTTAGYIIDRKKNHKLWLKSLQLRWKKDAEPKILSIRVEHSEDKKNWKVLKESEMVNNYKFNGIALKQNVIDINDHTHQYIKLTFLDAKYPPVLVSANAYTTNKIPSAVSWITAGTLQPLEGLSNSYRFSVSEGVNPSLLRLSFKKLNTVLSGALYTVENINGKLERKTAINSFTAYKVTLNNKVVNSKPINVSRWQSSEWLITANDASNLEADNLPDVMVAYPEYEIIFANDGDEPYTLVWGNSTTEAPVPNDIVKRIKASKTTLQDIAMVTRGRILNNAELTELMESRQWKRLMLLIGLTLVVIAIVAAVVKYQLYRSSQKA